MKRTLSNITALIFFSFLLIGGISVLQNVIQAVQKSFSPSPSAKHILTYEEQV